MSDYIRRLHAAIQTKRNAVVVGLDPRFDDLPQEIREADRRGVDRGVAMAAAYEEFCFRVIDVVALLVPAVKPQAAFFEECGPAGSVVLARVIQRAREAGLIVICDA